MPNFNPFGYQLTNQMNLPFNNDFGGQFSFPTPGISTMNVQNGLHQQQPMVLRASKKKALNSQTSKQTQYKIFMIEYRIFLIYSEQ